jgi:hypothetical protein
MWLAGSELFGAPQLLADEVQPGPTPSEPAPAVDETTEVQVLIGGAAEGSTVVRVSSSILIRYMG